MSFDNYESFDLNYATQGSSSKSLNIDLTMTRLKEYAESADSYNFPIYPQFHILTADTPTKNFTLYTYASHRGKLQGNESTGQHSFTRPYRIPLIEMHRISDVPGLPASKVYGRMMDAKLVKNKETGQAHVAGLGEVAHPEAVYELLHGLWLTGSLGSTVHGAHCSICNAPLRTIRDIKEHPHTKGAYYRTAMRGDESDALGFTQADPQDRRSQLCTTSVDIYKATEYSKVVVPSDVQSVVDIVDTRTLPGSHFTGIPYFPTPKSGADPDASTRNSIEQALPTTSLWLPMKQSSSKGVSVYGERYVDVVSGREITASEMGFLSGLSLHEYVEQIHSEGFFENESVSYPSEKIHIPATREAGFVFSEDVEPCIACETGECIQHSVEPQISESTLSVKTRGKLQAGSFCGPGRSFPVHDQAHYTAALRLLARYKGPGDRAKIRACIMRKGRKNGWA